MPRKQVITAKIRRVLEAAYRKGTITLANVCPHCFGYMSGYDHGKCMHCGKFCGCSFDPTSSSDYCELHR